MKNRPRRGLGMCVALIALMHSATAQIADGNRPTVDNSLRYTFSWPLSDPKAAPRGGVSRGVGVTLDGVPSAPWRSLQERGLSGFERDRRAILALAGDYRVTFDFLEVASYTPGTGRERPYQSWGTERVYVDRDIGSYISLVHILEMRIQQDDGSISEPMVTKHWREDWQYEPREIVEFRGHSRWQARKVARGEAAERWSQTVDQVDESPRYAAMGRWQHTASFSSWLSGETARPLPRREASVRSDYQVLAGTNRITVTATGALQEENNLKTVLGENGQPDAERPYLAREYGVARYERLKDPDFAAANEYFERTRSFWDEVHDAWFDLFKRSRSVTFGTSADPTEILFGYADELAAGRQPAESPVQAIRRALDVARAP